MNLALGDLVDGPPHDLHLIKGEAKMTVRRGQKLWMQDGDEFIKVTVNEVTEKSIVVEFEEEGLRYFPVFDKDGKQPEGDDPAFDIYGRGADQFLCPRPLRGRNGGPFHLIGGTLRRWAAFFGVKCDPLK
jgi:hypothetical protein